MNFTFIGKNMVEDIFIDMCMTPGQGQTTRYGQNFTKTLTICHFDHLLQVISHLMRM